jgi:hypothetical protein
VADGLLVYCRGLESREWSREMSLRSSLAGDQGERDYLDVGCWSGLCLVFHYSASSKMLSQGVDIPPYDDPEK